MSVEVKSSNVNELKDLKKNLNSQDNNNNNNSVLNNGNKSIMNEVKQRNELFEKVYQKILTELTTGDEELKDVYDWIHKVIEYNVPHGKRNRGLAVVETYEELSKDRKHLELSHIIGWCIEIMQAFFLVFDDIMDKSITRRGRPCWYKVDEVSMMAVNDGCLLKTFVFALIQNHCSEHENFLKIFNLILLTCQHTEYGQVLDNLTQPEGKKPNYKLFTSERYATIVKYKTTFYSFVAPVRAAMYLAMIDDEKDHEIATKILEQMGHYFQVQDDYLDCYGDPETIGKIGTDIVDGKCSWLAIEARKRFDAKQLEQFEKHYGVKDEKSMNIIKELYNQVNVSNIFDIYENQSFININNLISSIPCEMKVKQKVFTTFLSKVYKRNK